MLISRVLFLMEADVWVKLKEVVHRSILSFRRRPMNRFSSFSLLGGVLESTERVTPMDAFLDLLRLLITFVIKSGLET